MNQVQVYFCLAFVSVIGFILVSRYWNEISPKISKILDEDLSLNPPPPPENFPFEFRSYNPRLDRKMRRGPTMAEIYNKNIRG